MSRHTKEHNFITGDHVLLKQKTNKCSTVYEPAFYMITCVDGSSIAARRIQDGRQVYRDASQYKFVNSLIWKNRGQTKEEDIIPDNERENLMKSIEEITQECTQDNESNISTKETETISTEVGKETSQDVKPQGGGGSNNRKEDQEETEGNRRI